MELEDEEPEAMPDPPLRALESPLGLRLVGAEVVPPLSEVTGFGFCSHAPKASAPATARIPIMSLRFIAFSRVVRCASTTPGRFLKG